MENYFVGIDIGCGGAKATIINDQGAVMGYGFHEHHITVSNGNWSETDPNEYWGNICNALQGMLRQTNLDVSKVRGISVSSAVPAIVMVDKMGQVINKAYNFLDTRAQDAIDELKAKVGAERCFDISGYNIDEQSELTDLIWEKKHRPQDYQRIHKALTPDGYVTYRLTGRMLVNYSAATFYGAAFDIRKKQFNSDVLKLMDIDPEILPEVIACEEIIGEVTTEAAALTGLKAGTPVIAGTVDAFAGWLGGGAIEPGETQLNLGTAAVLGMILEKPTFIRQIWNCIYPVNSKDNYVIFGSTLTGGYVMRYLRNNFSRYERFVEQNGGYDAYDLLNLDAEKIAPGSDGLITLPHLMGARTPETNPHARGVLFGLDMNHTKGHMVRSMMEGVAYSSYKQYTTMLAAGLTTKGPIVMNEGGAKSRLWRRIFTDVFGHPTVLLKNRTGAPYGNAILAGVCTGYLPSYQVAKEWAEYTDYMEPNAKTHEMYMEYFRLYNHLYDHIQDDYLELKAIRDKQQL
ncbi:MAG: FGGY family carbohydrate kinase [Clostridia bacterium]